MISVNTNISFFSFPVLDFCFLSRKSLFFSNMALVVLFKCSGCTRKSHRVVRVSVEFFFVSFSFLSFFRFVSLDLLIGSVMKRWWMESSSSQLGLGDDVSNSAVSNCEAKIECVPSRIFLFPSPSPFLHPLSITSVSPSTSVRGAKAGGDWIRLSPSRAIGPHPIQFPFFFKFCLSLCVYNRSIPFATF